MKKKLLILLLLLTTLLVGGCQKQSIIPNQEDEVVIPENLENPIVTMEIKDYGTVKMELYPKVVYNTVANFVTLIESGFYDNNTFHRLVKEFVLQGGDPTASGAGGPGYTIKGEFAYNGISNDISHTEGILSMARLGNDFNSAGSQFFIVLSDKYTYVLNNSYASFGKVIEGMDIIHQIENDSLEFSDEENGILKSPLTITKTTVDTKGHNYQLKKIET